MRSGRKLNAITLSEGSIGAGSPTTVGWMNSSLSPRAYAALAASAPLAAAYGARARISSS